MAAKKIANLRPSAPVEKIGLEDAKRILCLVNCGLTDGLGEPVPGQMCVEAAVNYGLGYGHDDQPKCVDADLRSFKIMLNDTFSWDSNESRGDGLRRLAIAQLGTNKNFKFNKFIEAFQVKVLEFFVYPRLVKEVAQLQKEFEAEMARFNKEVKKWIKGDGSVPSVDFSFSSERVEQLTNHSIDFAEDQDSSAYALVNIFQWDEDPIDADEIAHICSELAVEALEETHPRLESLKWLNSLTKKPKIR